MTQSRRMSAVESAASTAIGFVVALVATATVLPLFGLHPSGASSVGITAVFTVISLVRGYYVRRFFEWLHGRA